MADPHFLAFLAFVAASIVVSLMVVRGANFLYGKLGTCHPASYHVEAEGDDYERVAMKVTKLGLYNFIVVISTTGLLFLYDLSPFGSNFGIGLESWIALVLISLLMNFSLRVASLADIRTEFQPDILGRSLGFGFGFLLSIYFLMLFGAGTHVMRNGLDFRFSGKITVANDLVSIFILLVVFGPWISAILSEALLHPRILGVYEEYMDDLGS